jgi:hypothetical protein
MSINTKAVRGRRRLRFASFDELLAEAERLAAAPRVRMLGNWPFDRLLHHLTAAVHGSIDGIDETVPGLIRYFGPLLKHWGLRRGFPAGFRLSKSFEAKVFPPGPATTEALGQLREALDRARLEPMTAVHPVFGRLTHDEWIQFHLRHAELHLSFAVAEDDETGGPAAAK